MSFRACTEANDMEVVRTMAKATWKMPEDFLMKVSRLADKTDEIIPKVLEAGAEVVEDKVRSNLQSVIGSGMTPEAQVSFCAPLALLPPCRTGTGILT